jgi:hypothetical protein
MLRRIFRNLLGLLLTAMMLASSVIPPGFRHAHAGGDDLNHGHSNDPYSVSDRISGNEYKISRPCQDIPVFDGYTFENSLGDNTTHRHFQLFGFSVALPDTNHSPKRGDDSPNNQFVSIRATENISLVTQSNSDMRNWLMPISQDYSPYSVTALSAIPYSLQPVTSTLLCDRARHERSGVQLI